MSAVLAATGVSQRPAPLLPALRFELAKLLTQWRTRVVLLACLVAPGLFVAVVSAQTALPTDTVFGRWMHASGWAGSLVVLAFACSWGLPLLTSLVAGDVFAAEDRLGTWRHLLVAVRAPSRIFLVKAVASLAVLTLMVAAVALSSVAGGLLGVGGHPLVGLDGQSLAGADVARLVALAWLAVLAPTAAFAAIGLLGSVVLGRSPMGLLLPAVLALAMDLVLLLPVPAPVRLALPSGTFLAWRGLFTEPLQLGPLYAGIAVSLAWAAVATATAHRLFTRRDFTDLAHDGLGPRALLAAAAPLAALVLVTTGTATAVAGPGSGITRTGLETSLSTAFAHLYRLQTDELHRPAVTEDQLHTRAHCDKGGSRVADRGAGSDWRCTVSWQLPGSTARGTAIYQLDVAAEGRYVADGDGPREVNGNFALRTSRGDAPNPLWQVDGHVDLF